MFGTEHGPTPVRPTLPRQTGAPVHPVLRPVALAAVATTAAALGACRGGDTAAVASFQTVTDTIGDTIVVRTVGAVDSAIARQLVPELSIGQLDGPEEYIFGSVGDVLPRRDGGVYVWDYQSDALRRYDSSGTFVRQVGRKGGGPGEYESPIGMDLLHDGRLAIWDAQHQRVNLYDTAGTFVSSWRAPTNHFLQRALLVDSAGRIDLQMPLAPDDPTKPTMDRRLGIVRFQSDGSAVDSLAPPAMPELAGLEVTTVIDGKVVGSGRYYIQYVPQPTWSPSPLGYIVSTTADRYAVLLGRPGHPMRIERDVPDVPVEAAERDAIRAGLTRMIQRRQPGWSWNGPDVPARKPAVARLTVDADGRVWVGRSLPSVKLPPAEDDTTHTPRWSSPNAYDIYSPDGRLLGYLPVPKRTWIMRARGDTLWGSVRDSLDVETVVRFRVQPSLGH